MPTREFSQEYLNELVSCPKKITTAPHKELKLINGSHKNDMRLSSIDGSLEFRVFMRRNEMFPEKFSIGLEFIPRDGSGNIILLRCNGPHGPNKFIRDKEHSYHAVYHIHKAKAENIAAGFKAEMGGESNESFASYEDALYYFIDAINIDPNDAEKYFKGRTKNAERNKQLTLNLADGLRKK